MRASEIDFANCREIYNGLKQLETFEFEDHPRVVVVNLDGKHTIKVTFTYEGVTAEHALGHMNSFFLDHGFKNFCINTEKDDAEGVVLSTIFKPRK